MSQKPRKLSIIRRDHPSTPTPSTSGAPVASPAPAVVQANAQPTTASLPATTATQQASTSAHPQPKELTAKEQEKRRAYGYRIQLKRDEKEIQDLLRKEGISFELQPATLDKPGRYNPHEGLAICREAAIKQTIIHALELDPDHIIGLYASRHEHRMMKVIHVDGGVTFDSYFRHEVPEDYTRFADLKSVGTRAGVAYQPPPELSQNLVLMMVDTYFLGRNSNGLDYPFTPDNLAAVLGNNKMVLAMQRFEGRYGGLGTGSWVRDRENLIRARADAAQQEFAPHSPVDWIHRPGATAAITWTVKSTVSKWDIIVVQPNTARIPAKYDDTPLGCFHGSLPQSWAWYVSVYAPKFVREFLRPAIEPHYIPRWVDNDTFTAAKRMLYTKSSTSWTLKTLLTNAEEAAVAKAPMAFARHGDLCYYFAHEAAMVAWFQDAENRAILDSSVLQFTDPATIQMNESYRLVGAQPKRSSRAVTTVIAATLLSLGAITFYGGFKVATRKMTFLPKLVPKISWLLSKFSPFSVHFHLVSGKINLLHDVILAPAYEEWFKHRVKPGALAIASFETACVIKTNKPRKRYIPLIFLGKFFFHNFFSKMSLPTAIALHSCWNLACWLIQQSREPRFFSNIVPFTFTITNSTTPWLEFVKNTYVLPWKERVLQQSGTIARSTFGSKHCWVPRQTTAYYPTTLLDPLMELSCPKGLCNSEDLPGDPVCFYLPVNVPVYTPGGTAAMHSAAVLSRIIAPAPYPDAVLHSDYLTPWKRVVLTTVTETMECFIHVLQGCDLDNSPIVWEDVHPIWYANYDPHKRRIMESALKQIDDGAPQHNIVTINAKTDEVLPKTELELKPRSIARVNPKWQVAMGPFFFEITKRLKAALSTLDWEIECDEAPNHTYHMRFAFGSGLNELELSEVGNEAYEWATTGTNRYFVLCAGDDSYIFHSDDEGKLEILEGDYSKFDCSCNHAHHELLGPLWAACGMPDKAIRDWLNYIRGTGVVGYTPKQAQDYPVTFTFKHRGQQWTGGPETTVANTIKNMFAWVVAIKYHEFAHWEITEVFEKIFGFKIKLKITDMAHASFLKGIFIPAQVRIEGEIRQMITWIVCPSRIIKMGKTITDPRTIYHTKDLEGSTQQFAQDIATCYRAYINVPIIGAFVKRFNNPDRAFPSVALKEVMPYAVNFAGYKTNVEFLPLYPEQYFESFAAYYHVEMSSLLEADSLYKDVPLFTFLEHPVFWALAARDY